MYKNIIFVSSLTRDGYEFRFINDVCTIYYRNKVICLGYLQNGLYYVDNKCKTVPSTKYEINATKNVNLNLKQLWHLRLGHVVEDRITKLVRMEILSTLGNEPSPTYESCLQNKMTRSPFVG